MRPPTSRRPPEAAQRSATILHLANIAIGTVDKQAVEKALGEILRGGRDHIVGLVDVLAEAGKGDDLALISCARA